MDLKTLAAIECTVDIVLRGQPVTVRPVPSRVQRRIEELLPYTPVIGSDPAAVAKRKASAAYQADARKLQFERAGLRAAYAADLTIDGLQFSDGPEFTTADAKKLVASIQKIMTDGELHEIHEASERALHVTRDAETAIGTGESQGN